MSGIARDDWLSGIAVGKIHLHTVDGACGFATYPDWFGFKNRQIDYYVLYMPLRGTINATFHDTSESITAHEGTIFLVSPRIRHSLRLAEPQSGITTYHFRFYSENEDHSRPTLADDYLFVPHAEYRSLQRDIARLYDLIRTPSPYNALQKRALWLLIFSEMFAAQAHHKPSAFTLQQRAVLDEFIAQHIHLRPTPQDMADQIGYSKDYFSRIFKKTYGESPRRWIMLERIRYAAAMLLETQKSITQISVDLGYRDVYLFSRQFKAVHDCSPQAYRLTYSR